MNSYVIFIWYYQVHSVKKGANTEQSKRCVKKSSAEGSAHGCGWWLCSCNPAYFPDVEILILFKYAEQ